MELFLGTLLQSIMLALLFVSILALIYFATIRLVDHPHRKHWETADPETPIEIYLQLENVTGLLSLGSSKLGVIRNQLPSGFFLDLPKDLGPNNPLVIVKRDMEPDYIFIGSKEKYDADHKASPDVNVGEAYEQLRESLEQLRRNLYAFQDLYNPNERIVRELKKAKSQS